MMIQKRHNNEMLMKIFYYLLTIIIILLVNSHIALATNHLFLIDTSGSMKSFLSNPAFRYFISNKIIGSNEIFKDGDAIIIRSFNNRFLGDKKPTFRKGDPDRFFPDHGAVNKIQLDQKIRSIIRERIMNRLRNTRLDTDLLEGLQLAYADASRYFDPSKTTVIWMITDNEQDLGKALGEARWNIIPFYQEVYHNSRIEMTYFIPIIIDLQNAKNNLICYAFLYSSADDQRPSSVKDVKMFMTDVEAMSRVLAQFPDSIGKTGKAIRCKPALMEAFELDRKIEFMNEDQIKFIQDGSLLRFYLTEGVPFLVKLRLRFKSRSEYWKIDKARLEEPILIFTNNEDSLFAEPPNSVCRIRPREITLQPLKSTQRSYELILGYGEEGLFIPTVSRSSFRSFLPWSKEILNAILSFKLPVDIDSQVFLQFQDLSQILSTVKMLDKIKDFMLPQLDTRRTSTLEARYPVEFQINFALWRKILFWLSIPVIILILILVILASRKRISGEWKVRDSGGRFSLKYFKGFPIKVGTDYLGSLGFLPIFGLKFYSARNVKPTNQPKNIRIKQGLNRIELNLRENKYLLQIRFPDQKRVPRRKSRKESSKKQKGKNFY